MLPIESYHHQTSEDPSMFPLLPPLFEDFFHGELV
ncbi:hypothetical protein SAMN05444392_11116 [Seinonella peptonophila]|uniref:Uncharacterized protein n=1 Tax=Seinonella peptonophila TaxID=112248 RepID=A0A1M4ZWI6_9BACL|nr:hypothetical protein SAMN05444392_11116 [Seinonella peptonophila]